MKNHTHQLSEDDKRILALVDDESTVEILARRAAPSMRAGLADVLRKLESGGFIQDSAHARAGNMPRMSIPKTSTRNRIPEESDDLDFTSGISTPSTTTEASERAQAEVARLKEEQEAIRARLEIARAKAEAEAVAREEVAARAKQGAEMARIKAEQETAAVKIQLVAEQAKGAAETRTHVEAEARAKREVEMVRLKSEQEAARVRAEAEALRIKMEQDAAKAKAELEALRQEAERTRMELERARVAAEDLAKRETQAARMRDEEAIAKAHAEAEVARIKTEREASEAETKARQEAEIARIKADQEAARIKAEAEAKAKAKQEAEAVRRKAEEEIAQARAEVEAARLKAEQEALRVKAEAQARAEAEIKAKQETEAVRRKAEEEIAQARAEMEAARLKAEQEALRVKAEAHQARAEAETRAKQEAEAARRKAEEEIAQARGEAEAARLKAEQEALRVKAEAQEKAKQEAEAVRRKAEEEIAQVRAEGEAARLRAEQEALRVKAEARAEAETKAKQEAEAVRRKAEEEIARARAEVEAARLKAEQEASRVKVEAQARTEADAKARHEAEAVRRKAEDEAVQARAAAEAAHLKAEQAAVRTKAEAQARAEAEAEAKAKQEAEAARRKAEEEVAQAKAEAGAARLEAEHKAAQVKAELEAANANAAAEARARVEAEARAKQEALKAEQDIAKISLKAKELAIQVAAAKSEAAMARSMIATVLFFDVVGYTKLPVSRQIELKKQFNKLVSEFISNIEENQRIILDTGDGAAIGFLQHPEDAIEVAMLFRQAVTANKHQNYPELKVRMGINLGPVNVVKDMNGQSNMVGDGINDAQRIMSFAKPDHIYISRPYFDVVSRLSAEYAKLFKYRGVEDDKHGRQHQLYEVIDEQADGGAQPVDNQEFTSSPIQLEPFALSKAAQTAAPPGTPQLKDARNGSAVTRKQAEATHPVEKLPVQPDRVAQKSQKEIEAEAKAAAQQKAQREAEAAQIKAKQEKARIKAEEEARKMAEEQARAWKEAEQRAREDAVAEAQSRADHAAQAPQAKPVQQVARPRRKPLPLGKIFASLVILSLVLIAALPYVWPMQGFVAQVEKTISAQLKQPVHIAHMKAALLPLPKLELQDVAVGRAQELKAGNVVLNFSIATLFSDAKVISSMEVRDLALSAESFAETLSWLRAAGGEANYPVTHMVLQRMHVNGEGLVLPALSGSADWDAQGHFTKAALSSEDGKLNVELRPLQSLWQLALNIRESSLPLLPDILFNELEAKGEVGEGLAKFSEISGRLYGGSLTGTAQLGWQKGWQAQGRLNVKSLELHDALPQADISGEMGGDINFALSGAKLPQLISAPRLDGNFVVKKGVISKVDVVETARTAQKVPGGRTHFDELGGSLQVENSSQHFRQLRISAGMMSAEGSVDVSPGKQLSGRLTVDLRIRSVLDRVPLVLSGTVTEPVLRSAR